MDKNERYNIKNDVKFFSEFNYDGAIMIPKNMPDIGQVISISADYKVIDMKAVGTMKGISMEGQHLTGKACAVDILLKERIMYYGDEPEQSVYILENESMISRYVAIPPLIEGTDIETLIKHKHLKASINVNNTAIEKVSPRSVYRNIMLHLEIYTVPTYELCCNVYKNSSTSDIFICYEDGTQNKQLTFNDGYAIIHPEWSPKGEEIAYLSNCGNTYMLYTLNIKNNVIKRVTDPWVFKSVTSFSWSKDGWSIIFSSSTTGSKELFSVDLHSLEWKQLTRGDSLLKNYKPKCSPDGSRIAFIKSISGITYLYTMSIRGTDLKRAASQNGIKDFDWSHDGRHICFICSRGGKPDEVWVTDTESYDERVIESPGDILEKRRIKISPDGRSIAFIGSYLSTDDIFICDFLEGVPINITRNFTNIQVSDYAWKVDSSKIYCSMNELFYYNIYSISVTDGRKHQITNTDAGEIEMSYRPRLK